MTPLARQRDLLFACAAAVVLMARAGAAQSVPRASVNVTPEIQRRGAADSSEWQEVAEDQIDLKAITARGMEILSLPGISWRHAQTPHFVIHYEQAIFARKVARMAEFFYGYVSQDLQAVKDRVRGRSHIFIFRSEKRWADFRKVALDVPAWTFSRVEGPVMFLQQADNTTQSGRVLAHEMTHLVTSRFFARPIPLWLDEGLAEYYGEFAYAAFKGVKKSKRAQFGRLEAPYPLGQLLYATRYPSGSKEVRSFYETAKYLVAFLLLDQPPHKLMPFMEQLVTGQDAAAAFAKNYGLNSVEEIQRAFAKFAF